MSEGYRWNSSSPLLYNSDEWCRRLIANSPSQTGMKTRKVTRIALFIPSFVLESSTQHPPQDLRASVKLRCYKFKSYSSAVGNLKPVHLSIANLKNKDLTPLLRGKGPLRTAPVSDLLEAPAHPSVSAENFPLVYDSLARRPSLSSGTIVPNFSTDTVVDGASSEPSIIRLLSRTSIELA